MTVLPPWSPGELRAQLPALLADPAWRTRYAAAAPLPFLARRAPAMLATAALAALGRAGTGSPAALRRAGTASTPGPVVHVARAYLAPLGIALAQRLGPARVTLDLDDDDQQVAWALGNLDEGAAYGRLVGVFGPLFDAVALACAAEAAAVSARHGLVTRVIPNAVDLPPPGNATSPASTPGPEHSGDPEHSAGAQDCAGPGHQSRTGLSVLFVGNLSYPPNRDAACTLVDEVLPRLRRLVPGPVTVTLAGATGGHPALAALATQPGVRVLGFVADLEPCYAHADVVAAPLAAGGGTRIKLLEAMARGLPVVTSSAGAAGLDVRHDVQLLIADSPGAAARAICRLARDPALGRRLGAQAAGLVRQRYSTAAVTPLIREFLAPTTGDHQVRRLTPIAAEQPC